MECTVLREDLIRGLLYIQGAVDKRSHIPTAGHIFVEPHDKKINLLANDMDLSICAYIPASISGEKESFLLPARKCLDVIRHLPEGIYLKIALEKGKAILTTDEDQYCFPLIAPNVFPLPPPIESVKTLEIPVSILQYLLEQTGFAVSEGDLRPYLNGILLSFEPDKCVAVGTDGHRLSWQSEPISNTIDARIQIVLPKRAIAEALRLLSHAETLICNISTKQFKISCADFDWTTTLIQTHYPEIQSSIDLQGGYIATLNRNALKLVLQRLSALSDRNTGALLTFTGNKLCIRLRTTDREEGTSFLPIVGYEGPSIEIGMNIRYILDYLQLLRCESVRVYLRSPSERVCWMPETGENARYIIMPMLL